MDPEQKTLLALSILPARLNVEQTAQLLGFAPHDIPILVGAGLLRPLGRPAPSSVKYFAAAELRALAQDVKFLSKATEEIQRHWRRKNHTQPPSVKQRQRTGSSDRSWPPDSESGNPPVPLETC